MAEAGPVTASDTLSMSDAISGPEVGLWISNAADTLNNWSDAVSKESAWTLSFSDTLNSWSDTLLQIYHRNLGVSDDLNSFSDAAAIFLLGQASVSASDDVNNLSDALTLQSDWLIQFYDTLDSWQDDASQVIEILLSVADDSDNLTDDVLAVLLAGLTASVSSNLDSWDDAALAEFLSRLAQSKRANLIPYIRRYLNDVERPTTHELHLSVGDNAGNWNDSVS